MIYRRHVSTKEPGPETREASPGPPPPRSGATDGSDGRRSAPVPRTGDQDAPAERPQFDTARRGYDRAQVDARIRELTDTADSEHRRARTAQTRLARARDDLTAARAQLDGARQPEPVSEDGFGSRVEKLLRLAEQEAAAVRDAAAAEASSVQESARTEAIAHREQVENDLIARATKMDEDTAERTAELDRREREIDEKRAQLESWARRRTSAAGLAMRRSLDG